MSANSDLERFFSSELCIPSFTQAADLSGKILTTLMLANRSLSLDDLKNELHAAKSAICRRIGQLEEEGLCVREIDVSSRKHYFRIADNLSSTLMNRILERTAGYSRSLQMIVEQMADGPAEAYAQMRSLLEMYQAASKLLQQHFELKEAT